MKGKKKHEVDAGFQTPFPDIRHGRSTISINVERFRANYFWIFLISAATVYTCQTLGISLPIWINNYLNDFLCLPIVLNIAQYTVRYLRNDGHLNIPFSLVVTMALLYSIYFEWFLPKVNLRYTSDFIDVALYFAGAFLFHLLNASPKSERIL